MRKFFIGAIAMFFVSGMYAEDLKVKINTGGTLKDIPVRNLEKKTSVAEKSTTGLILSAAGDQACEETVLGEISGWPESKVEMELHCVKVPFIGDVCTDLPRAYGRDCKKRIVSQVCYPSGNTAAATIKDCAVAGAGTAVAACLAGGCGAAGPAFELGFKACIAVKTPALVNEVSVGLTERTECEGWHPI